MKPESRRFQSAGARALHEAPGSLREKAARLGTTHTTVARWIGGVKAPLDAARATLCEEFGISRQSWERRDDGPKSTGPTRGPEPGEVASDPAVTDAEVKLDMLGSDAELDSVIRDLSAQRATSGISGDTLVRLSGALVRALQLRDRRQSDHEKLTRDSKEWGAFVQRLYAAFAHHPVGLLAVMRIVLEFEGRPEQIARWAAIEAEQSAFRADCPDVWETLEAAEREFLEAERLWTKQRTGGKKL